MTFQELDNRVDKWKNALKGPEMANIMVRIGIKARRLIFDRIKDTGVNAEGQKFNSPGYLGYSTKDILVGCSTFRAKDCTSFFNSPSIEWKSLRKKGVQKPAKGEHNSKDDYWRLAVLKGGYKQLREISNRPTSHVDFFFSGQMWQGINVKVNQGENANGIVVLGAIDKESSNKLNGNANRFGKILQLSKSEVRELSRQFINEVKKIINTQ